MLMITDTSPPTHEIADNWLLPRLGMHLARTVGTVLLFAVVSPINGRQTELAGERPNETTQISATHALIKQRYLEFLVGTKATFNGSFGSEAGRQFLHRVRRPIQRAMAFDFSQDAGVPFRAFPEDPSHKQEESVYSPLLQRYLLSLAYAYCVDAPDSPYYQNAQVLRCYVRCLDYLHSRGIRDGMTFHNNQNRMDMPGAPKPAPDAANLAHMELRMGALCQSVLLMEPYFKETPTFRNARALVRHLEILGRTSGHVRYYEPYTNPPEFQHRVQSDAIQNYTDTTLVSALLEADPARQHELLTEAKNVFTDSLKVIPGWADTIKPDFTGYHHRGIYGNAYTGGFIPQAAFGAYVLHDTTYAVPEQSVKNLKNLILTYRLYCQKYAMPFGIRGRMPLSTDHLKSSVFSGILMYASQLSLDDESMRPVFARLWNEDQIGLDFLFAGGRGKVFRGMYLLEMLEELAAAGPNPEPDPNGFWYKPYGGLALHRRDDWMAAIKGHSKYIWDYENGEPDENVYGQYLSHGMLTIFASGNPVDDVSSGYRLAEGWDWYRLPGTTAVHFPMQPQKPLEHRQFSTETFLGAATCHGKNGVWGMILNQPRFGDGTAIQLKARKSAFFVNDLIVLLGTGISGGDGKHPIETTVFQTAMDDPDNYNSQAATYFTDPVGNGYFVRDPGNLKIFRGQQSSYRENGKTPTSGYYAVAWFDHGLQPRDDSYEAAVLVRGADSIERFASYPEDHYRVVTHSNALHHVEFPSHHLSGLVFFRAGRAKHDVIAQVSEPCLVMCEERSSNRIRMSVSNPDLGMLDRSAPPPDFRFLGRGDNQYLPSQAHPVQLTLRGRWRLKNTTQDVSILSGDIDETVVHVECLHGMDRRFELVQTREDDWE